MTRPAMRNFSDYGQLYTFIFYKQVELPETRSWATPARIGSTVRQARRNRPFI